MSIQDPAIERRMRRIDHLEEAQPKRFCYARLVFNTYYPQPDGYNLHEAESLGECRLDAEKNGNCWCGKWEFVDGEMRLSKRGADAQ